MDMSYEDLPSATHLAELAVVGGCLLETKRALDVAGIIDDRMFEDMRLGFAFMLVLDAAKSGQATDGRLVADRIWQVCGVSSPEDGTTFRSRAYWRGTYGLLADAVMSATPALVEQYAVKVRQAWLSRQLAGIAEFICEEAEDGRPADLLLMALRGQVERLAQLYFAPMSAGD